MMEGGREEVSVLLENALALARAIPPSSRPIVRKTLERTITRRAVLWLGQTCNLKCEFCYFIDRVSDRNHPEHTFMPLEKAKKICRTVAEYYGNTCIDIQGGEPTLYPSILELIRYCNDINLAPTLITNALLLDNVDLCRKYQEAGVKDFLISVQGLGQTHDRVVGCPGAHRRQMAVLRNLQEIGVPFRFNVVMSKGAVPQLPAISRLAIETGAFVVNFIAFNPFADQAETGRRKSDNVPRYSEVTASLTQAIDLLEEAGVEANVRYFPFCMVEERHRKNVYNFQQLSYDPHEWDFGSWGWTGLQPQRVATGEPSPVVELVAERSLLRHKGVLKNIAQNKFLRPIVYQGYRLFSKLAATRNVSRDKLYREVAKMHSKFHCGYVHGKHCHGCHVRPICDGFHGDYAAIFGADEASPLELVDVLDDPKYYLKLQTKTILSREKCTII